MDHLVQPSGLVRRNVQRFRGGLVFKAHRLLYHSTLGLSVIKKKKVGGPARARCDAHFDLLLAEFGVQVL